MVKQVVVVYGGELANDVAQQIVAKKPASADSIEVSLRNASERPKTLLEYDQDTVVCFVIQTIENAAPTEDVSHICFSNLIYILIHSSLTNDKKNTFL